MQIGLLIYKYKYTRTQLEEDILYPISCAKLEKYPWPNTPRVILIADSTLASSFNNVRRRR